MEAGNIPCRRRYFIFLMETSSDSLWKLAQELHSSASLVCRAQLAPLDLGKVQLPPCLQHTDVLSGTPPCLHLPHRTSSVLDHFTHLMFLDANTLSIITVQSKGSSGYFFKSRDSFFVRFLQREKLEHNLGT